MGQEDLFGFSGIVPPRLSMGPITRHSVLVTTYWHFKVTSMIARPTLMGENREPRWLAKRTSLAYMYVCSWL